jgi:hypothetical protein
MTGDVERSKRTLYGGEWFQDAGSVHVAAQEHSWMEIGLPVFSYGSYPPGPVRLDGRAAARRSAGGAWPVSRVAGFGRRVS